MEYILIAHQKKYQNMQAVDFYKLMYQQTFGNDHYLTDEIENLRHLVMEHEQLEKTDGIPFTEPIGNGYVRVNLASEEVTEDLLPFLNKLFIQSTNRGEGRTEELERKFERAMELAREDRLSIDADELKNVFVTFKSKNYPQVSHSKTYHERYAPHYRVLDASYLAYLPVLRKLVEFAKEDTPKLIAIDGRCGSGKTTFPSIIKETIDCNVFHMDDFFLPKEMKTEKRLKEPGGNVHYERVLEEIVLPLTRLEEVKLIPFDCTVNDLDKATIVPYKKINVIEGVYSLHPVLEKYYDYKVFMTVDQDTQIKRIIERGHEAKLDRFVNEWIPLEENYIKKLDIPDKADIWIDTSKY